ncbi:type II secretion system protein [Sulfurovum sp.]|uniref:type II secretion system protein n=1 Tax=Sulfurovum sp. TaxID=1969726 RepID=UPI0035643BCC
MRRAFSMIELVFVIVVIGILSAIAIPKFAATRDDALVSKARATVGALRTAIATERQKKILRGDFTDINATSAATLLDYGLDSRWTGLTFSGPGGTSCAFSVTNNKLVKGSCNVPGMSDL